MLSTIRAILRPDQPNVAGLYNVDIVSTYKRKRAKKPTGIWIKKEQWTDTEVNVHKYAATYNRKIRQMIGQKEAYFVA